MGELGWELYVPSEFAVHVYDAIVEAGADLGLRLAGYHALDSLRIEKGFVHLGHDVGPTDDFNDESYTPRVMSPRSHRLVSLKLEDPDPVLLHGESVIADERIVGTVMSSAYAHTIGAAAGLAMVDSGLLRGDEVTAEVDCAGTLVKANLAARPFYDPTGSRMRA